MPQEGEVFSTRLLTWYRQNARTFPWRIPPGGSPQDPYYVWISEIMLQQTGASTVVPFFQRFMNEFPTVRQLAEASEEAVLFMWQGLGYYSRARNLHKAAKALVQMSDPKGPVHFPQTEAEWRGLPGVGVYTAAACAAIAGEQPAVALDANVIRILCRYFNVHGLGIQGERQILAEKGASLLPTQDYGDYTQALMDLGALVCVGRGEPACPVCPVSLGCERYQRGYIPPPSVRKPKPHRYGYVFLVCHPEDGKILVCQNHTTRLLKGLFGFPITPWKEGGYPDLPDLFTSDAVVGVVEHTFTHFHLHLSVWKGRGESPVEDIVNALVEWGNPSYIWIDPHQLDTLAFSTLMRKVQRFLVFNPLKRVNH